MAPFRGPLVNCNEIETGPFSGAEFDQLDSVNIDFDWEIIGHLECSQGLLSKHFRCLVGDLTEEE